MWLEDAHYNANKFDTEQTNTFSWDNLAFDGPVLPRDLGFDIPDNTQPAGTAENGLPMTNTGWLIPDGAGQKTHAVDQEREEHGGRRGRAARAHVLARDRGTLTYSVNGNPPHAFPWAFGANSPTFESKTIAMPVPLSEVHDGTNTVTLSTSDTANGVTTANYDLILAGAGG